MRDNCNISFRCVVVFYFLYRAHNSMLGRACCFPASDRFFRKPEELVGGTFKFARQEKTSCRAIIFSESFNALKTDVKVVCENLGTINSFFFQCWKKLLTGCLPTQVLAKPAFFDALHLIRTIRERVSMH